MTDQLKEAIEVLRTLPEDKQETLVRAILEFASQDASGASEYEVVEKS